MTSVRVSLGAAIALFCHTAAAQTGVSDDRVSLPSGPGSLQGIGENVGLDLNMGAMTYSVPVEIPGGFPGVTPHVALSYSSAAGTSVVGMGWDLDMPSIERMTYRGLPKYGLDDDFAGLGGQQLVLLPGSIPPTYRQRYESSFVRYTWHAAGTGAEGYWVAEFPDGRVATFGATSAGTLVSNARVSGPDGTFRYHLVEQADTFGHVLRYEYSKSGAVSLLQRVGWVHAANGDPRYSVTFAYESASDASGTAYLSDAKPGFEVLLTQRLKTISVFSGIERIRRYELTYDGYADSGGFTRLTRVQMYGQKGGIYPAVYDFTYSQALGGVCTGAQCLTPFLVDLGSTGVNVSTGRATFVDIDGNSLPDLVSTPVNGNHQILRSIAKSDGTTAFAPAFTSVEGTSNYQMGTGRVQVLDVNGDGLADLLNGKDGTFLPNLGTGDWGAPDTLGIGDLPSFETDFDLSAEDDLKSIRFMDYDNDKRIDVVKSPGGVTQVFRNLGGGGFQTDLSVAAIGEDFAAANLDLIDMNGDGLLDPVVMSPGQVRYRLNLGRGRWSDWTTIENAPLTQSILVYAELVDLNGDGLADLVLDFGTTLQVGISRNGSHFLSLLTITSADINGGELPERKADTTVLFADMNGSGSTDVVWLDADGHTRYLDLFPVRPNLLNRIENGLGAVTEVTYGTSVAHMAKDAEAGTPWTHPLPHPMIVVDEVLKYEALAPDIREITRHSYHEGYYAGADKQFRGYERVEETLVGDETQEGGETKNVYDVGVLDGYRKGLLLHSTVSSGGRTLSHSETTYEDCEVAAVTGSPELPIRHICPTSSTTVIEEGMTADRFVTTQTQTQYDGYGNAIVSSNLGVTQVGGSGCAPCSGGLGTTEFGVPCGPQCVGDELVTETDYIPPSGSVSGRYVVQTPYRVRTYGTQGGLTTEEIIYYDGPAFVGLPAGQVSDGLPTRTTRKKTAGAADVIASSRNKYNADGQVVETLDPLGASGSAGHRRAYTYDEAGLRVVTTDLFTGTAQLRRETQYEPLFDKPVESTAWMRVENAAPVTARRSTYYSYDEFGRLASLAKPGDTLQSPTQVYTYELAAPVSRIVTKSRATSGGPLDLESIACVDGKGRTVQTRTRLDSGKYQVTGISVFNVRNAPVRVYQPFVGNTGECEAGAPAGVLVASTTYDAAYRPMVATQPDATLYGAASTTRIVHEPLATLTYDEDDTDPQSPHTNTPETTRTDGLGRVVSLERALAPGQTEAVSLRYDSLGRLTKALDPESNPRTQTYDLLGRVLSADGPNTAGQSTIEYDDAGNVIRMTDERGIVVRQAYDGLNRPVEKWADADKAGTLITWAYDVAPIDCDPGLCTNTPGAVAETTYPLTGLEGGPGRDWFGYDVRGRTSWQSRTLRDFSFEEASTYDNADRLVEVVYPDGTAVAPSYDAASRLTGVADYVSSVSFDDRGLMASLTLANGVVDSHLYDARMRPSEARTTASSKVLQGFKYTRDRVGNITNIKDLATSSVQDATATFSYDAWYRVTAAKQGAETLSFGFDSLDNITSKTSSEPTSPANVGTYTYGLPNAVASAGGIAFEYDAAGHVTRRGEQAYTWDAFGRLTRAARHADDSELARSIYGASESRVAKVEHADEVTLYVAPDFEVRDGIAVTYVRVGQTRVARIDTSAIQAQVYSDVAPAIAPDGEIHAADAWVAWAAGAGVATTSIPPSDPAELLNASARRLLIDESGESVTYLHDDHLGSLTLATDKTGAVVGRRAFHATGTERAGGSGFVDNHGFTGQELDAATGLVHFGFRSLDPVTGRWMAIDPLFEQLSPSLIQRLGESTTDYAYVAGNFENATDPTGLAGRLKAIVKSVARRLFGGRTPPSASATGAASAAGSTPGGGSGGGTTQYANAPTQYANAPTQYANAPTQYANAPTQYANGPTQYANAPTQYANAPTPYANAPSPYSHSPAGGGSGGGNIYGRWQPAGGSASGHVYGRWQATSANAYGRVISPGGGEGAYGSASGNEYRAFPTESGGAYGNFASASSTGPTYVFPPPKASASQAGAGAPRASGPYGVWTPVTLR